MAHAITPRHNGEYLQARIFWLRVCDLFRGHTQVDRVGFELSDAKSFDDVVVFFRQPVHDGVGGHCTVNFEQVKFHATPAGRVTAQALITPEFIGATSQSLLQKLMLVQRQHAPTGHGALFTLRQPYPVDSGDPLEKLVDKSDGHLRLNVLFDGTTDRSEMGRVRKLWREHLCVDDDELRRILRPLRLVVDQRTLVQVRDALNDALQLAGMRPVDAASQIHPYDDLAWKLAGQHERLELDRAMVEQILKQENLYIGPPLVQQDARRLGVRSFSAHAKDLHVETDALYCAVEHFDKRLIRNRAWWNDRIYPDLRDFLEHQLRPGERHHLYLEAHGTLAFAAGYAAARSAATIIPMFRRTPWEVSGTPRAPHSPVWTFERQHLGEAVDTAVAISVAQPVDHDVRCFLEDLGSENTVGHLIEATVAPQPGATSVQSADHAFVLADELVNHLQQSRRHLPRGTGFKLFAAAPNPLMYFLGARAKALGSIELYEFDPNDRCYHPALRLP